MIDLDPAILMKTPWQFRQGVGEANINVECIHVVLDGLPASGQGEGITLYIVRWPDKQPEVFGQFTLGCHPKVEIDSLLDQTTIKVISGLKSANVDIGYK